MRKESVFIKTLVVLILLNFTLHPVMAITFENKTGNGTYSMESVEDISPGEIIDISFSNYYPTLGEPIEIKVIIKVNPTGNQFTETLTVMDEFEGIIVQSSEAQLKTGSVLIDQKEITIGKLPRYTKKITWYPVVVGNHSLHFTLGSYPVNLQNISVGYDFENIIFPSLGCPSLICKDKTDKLTVVISEERYILEDPIEIYRAELQPINDPSIYLLYNQTVQFRTWLYVNEDEVEDNLILSYDTNNIPGGFYNIKLITAKK